ncbi:MAG TPA: 2-keto-3-deoxygluconate permease [Candidatus Acidoferrum sp.]|nr:2-keto-3-deoxygluconate permease [Candidatus Acidoferrum sp.]
MKILKGVNKIPGGLMVVPLLAGAILNTFWPGLTRVGGMVTALWSPSGTGTLIALALFVMGTQISPKQAPVALKRGGVLLVTKFLAGFVIGVVIGKVFGPAGFMGVSVLACFSAITNSNGGLFIALNMEYGDGEDVLSQALLGINDGPFLTLLALGASGMGNIPIKDLVIAIMPMVLGCVIGMLDPDIAEYLAPMNGKLTPFFGFTLGQGIDLKNAWMAGLGGIILSVLVVLGSGIPLIYADRFLNKRRGYSGAAASSAAGNAAATPAIIAEIDPTWAPLAPAATASISAAVCISAVLTPMLTSWAAKKWGCPKFDREKAQAEAAAQAQTATPLSE